MACKRAASVETRGRGTRRGCGDGVPRCLVWAGIAFAEGEDGAGHDAGGLACRGAGGVCEACYLDTSVAAPY